MLTKEIAVTQWIKVTIDDDKFDDAFMAEYREHYRPFYDLDDHLKHLAQLHARGIYDDDDFIEGYGPAKDMGIRFEIVDQSERVEEEY